MGYEVKENEMGGACSAHWRDEENKILVGDPEGKT
jgi:hypothetical protein